MRSHNRFSINSAHKIGLNELFENKNVVDELAQEQLEMIERSAKKANNVIGELLRFSRITQLVSNEINVEEALKSAIQLSKQPGKTNRF